MSMVTEKARSGCDEARPCRLAIVVPCHNEEEMVATTVERLASLLVGMAKAGVADAGSVVILVDDGSSDSTWREIRRECEARKNVRGIKLCARSGHQNAIMAALGRHAWDYDATVTIDADLQDDPDCIYEMLERYQEGCDVVYGVRRCRASDSWFKRFTAQTYYRVLERLGVRTIYNHSDFRLLSLGAWRRLSRYGERNLYLRGIVPLLGGKQASVYYDRSPRLAGKSKYDFPKMMNFAVDGVTSFSVKPVRLIFTVGLLFLLVSLGVLIYSLVRYFGGHTIEGWTSLMLSIWLCTGILLMALGVIGEYIGKIYSEVKRRPRYDIEEEAGSRNAEGITASTAVVDTGASGFTESGEPVADIEKTSLETARLAE